jgi:hypothetical protein
MCEGRSSQPTAALLHLQLLLADKLQRLLRDDPAKGITAIKEPATFGDIRDAWSDNGMWGLYLLGLVRTSSSGCLAHMNPSVWHS